MIKFILSILLLPPMLMIASEEPRKKYTREELYALNPLKKKQPKEKFLKVPNNSPELKPASMPSEIDTIILIFKGE